MRTTILSCVAVAMLALVTINATANGPVQWHQFTGGYEKAKRERKPVVVDFYADWCHWCKVMDRQTFTAPKIANSLNREYVAIRVDMNSSTPVRYQGRSLSPADFASMMGVKGLPTVIFMDKSGEVVTRLPGFVRAETFQALLGYIRDECYNTQISFRDYMGGKVNCK